jgi:translation elongation factor EF-G
LIVSGLGELHLEILRDRIEIEYGIKAELGKMRVAYRESVGKTVQGELILEK